jgi:hypothetical protein
MESCELFAQAGQLISASYIARITDMSHWTWLNIPFLKMQPQLPDLTALKWPELVSELESSVLATCSF